MQKKDLYVPHHTHSTEQQTLLSQEILSTIPSERRFVERICFFSMKGMKNGNLWNFVWDLKKKLTLLFLLSVGSNKELDRIQKI